MKMKKMLCTVAGFATGFLGGVFLNDYLCPSYKSYIIRNSKIAKPVRFVYISDLHGRDFGNDNEILLEMIRKANVDFVVVGGDFVTAKYIYKKESMISFLTRLCAETKVYFSIGNHEAFLKWKKDNKYESYENLISSVRACGAVVLDNDTVVIDEYNISLSGLNLEKRFFNKLTHVVLSKHHLEELVDFKDKNVYNILLAHTPEYFEAYCGLKPNLILSGHMHGGIIRLPNGKGMINPRFKLFADYCWGHFKNGNVRMIISRGLSMHTIPIRLFNPPEVTVITLKGNKKKRY